MIPIEKALKEAADMLQEVADRPLLEAQILLAHYLRCDRVFLHAHPETLIAQQGYFELVRRRVNFEPIEYIIGEVSFYSRLFYIEPGVLIPRPETELLIDKVTQKIEPTETIAEIGVGSGVISILLKLQFPHNKVLATDINPKAISLAAKNAKKFGVQIELYQTSYLDGIGEEVDIIVSNPPYIKEGEKLAKPLDFEPKEALFGGRNGDEVLKEIIDRFFASRARVLACEMGYDQKEAIAKYVQRYSGFTIEFYQDLAGLDRGFVIERMRG